MSMNMLFRISSLVLLFVTLPAFGLSKIVLTNKSKAPYLYDVAYDLAHLKFKRGHHALDAKRLFKDAASDTIELREWLGDMKEYPAFLWIGQVAYGIPGDVYIINPLKYGDEIRLFIDSDGRLHEGSSWSLPIPKSDAEAKKLRYKGGVIYGGTFTHKLS